MEEFEKATDNPQNDEDARRLEENKGRTMSDSRVSEIQGGSSSKSSTLSRSQSELNQVCWQHIHSVC